jgi:hypothetical protein
VHCQFWSDCEKCDCLPKTTVHCQLHRSQHVYSFKANSSAFGCNRQLLRSRSDVVDNLQSLKVESGRGLYSDKCEGLILCCGA